jgi:hypothetical protein
MEEAPLAKRGGKKGSESKRLCYDREIEEAVVVAGKRGAKKRAEIKEEKTEDGKVPSSPDAKASIAVSAIAIATCCEAGKGKKRKMT